MSDRLQSMVQEWQQTLQRSRDLWQEIIKYGQSMGFTSPESTVTSMTQPVAKTAVMTKTRKKKAGRSKMPPRAGSNTRAVWQIICDHPGIGLKETVDKFIDKVNAKETPSPKGNRTNAVQQILINLKERNLIRSERSETDGFNVYSPVVHPGQTEAK